MTDLPTLAHLAAAHWSLVSDFLLAAFGMLLAGSVYLWDAAHEAMTRWAKANGYPQAPYGMAVHCDCGTAEKWKAWSAENDHRPRCGVARPNFAHFASGLEIRWYKWIGRDMEYNREPSPAEWRRIFTECVESIG